MAQGEEITYPEVGENILRWVDGIFANDYRFYDRDGNQLASVNSPVILVPHADGATYEYNLPGGGWRHYALLPEDYYTSGSTFYNVTSASQYNGYNPSTGTITNITSDVRWIVFCIKTTGNLTNDSAYIRRLT